MQIELIERQKSIVTVETYRLNVDGKEVVYMEYVNEKGKVDDVNVRDAEGNEIDTEYAASLMDAIEAFVDALHTESEQP